MAVLEIGISVNDRPGKTNKGDIIIARKPLGYVGKKEQANLLWLTIDTNLPLEELRSGQYYIPFILLSGLNIDWKRVTRDTEKYQPFIEPDAKDGKFRRNMTPLSSSVIRKRI